MPSSTLKIIHAARKVCVRLFVRGSWTEDSTRGTMGRRKRGSWCGIRERKAVPEMAEMKGREAIRGLLKRRGRAGPRRRGREAMMCW